jgi:hypothetical protein
MPRKLLDIEVEEVSIVDHAANRSKFAIIKRRKAMEEELKQLIKTLNGDEVTDVDLEKAGKMPEEAAKAIKGALAILSKYKDDFPADVLGAIKVLTKYSSYGYPQKGDDEMSKEDIEKVGARLSKATLEELKKISSALDGIDLKAIKKIREIVDGLIKTSESVEKKKAAYEGLSEEIRARLLRLDELEAEELKKAEDAKLQELVKAAVAPELKALKEELEKVQKSKGMKKSIDGQDKDDDKDTDDKKVLWPSL